MHLHGRLPEHPSIVDLDRLVIADGDFGRAYLTEGWAARFVAGLLRDFTLCFLGYSIDDPVMRYMTAAHALAGEGGMFAFAPCADSAIKASVNEQWQAKHVAPILYDDQDRHRLLHRTLHVWASLYRDGIRGKQRLVARYAHRPPAESHQNNDFVGRLLWALADPSGQPAQRFARLNPCPPLEWLKPLSDRRFGDSDLPRFGVTPQEQPRKIEPYSLIDRPAPHQHSARMHLVAFRHPRGDWDDVMGWLAEWLLRHLDDPRLVVWLAQSGGHVHPRWLGRLGDKLRELASLERNGKVAELETLRQQAPSAIPGPLMRTLWRLVINGRLYAQGAGDELERWLFQLQGEGLGSTLRLQLRDLLVPRVHLGPRRLWGEQQRPDHASELSQLVSWDLRLASDDVHTSLLLAFREDPHWQEALPHLLSDLQQVLQDALDLHHELRLIDSRSIPAWMLLLSLHGSGARSDTHNWVNVVLLLRDAWLATHRQDVARAGRIAQSWAEHPEPTFQRLALFAASQGCLSAKQWVEWLFADKARWLWNPATEQELHHLLECQGHQLAAEAQVRLEAAILAGPPPDAFDQPASEQTERERWLWERLTNLNTSGLPLGAVAKARLAELDLTFTRTPQAAKQACAPMDKKELIAWLAHHHHQKSQPVHDDPWFRCCSTHPLHALFSLASLAEENNWPASYWDSALVAWSRKPDSLIRRLWEFSAPVLPSMPDPAMREIGRSFSWYLRRVCRSGSRHHDILFDLCCRFLSLQRKESSRLGTNRTVGFLVTDAFSHPVGHITQALVILLFNGQSNKDDDMPVHFKRAFSMLCQESTVDYRHGRVLLAYHLLSLFDLDRDWALTTLIPRLSWENPEEASALWWGVTQGLTWRSAHSHPLLAAISGMLPDTAEQYTQLGAGIQSFAAFLTRMALVQPDTLSTYRSAFEAMPLTGMEAAAKTLLEALENAEQKEDFWRTRIRPFWRLWPKSANLVSPQISQSLARLVLATGDEFHDAMALLKDWLQKPEQPEFVVRCLSRTELCSCFPADALSFLDQVVDQNRRWKP